MNNLSTDPRAGAFTLFDAISLFIFIVCVSKGASLGYRYMGVGGAVAGVPIGIVVGLAVRYVALSGLAVILWLCIGGPFRKPKTEDTAKPRSMTHQGGARSANTQAFAAGVTAEMRIGKITSVENGPVRDVKVRISSRELFSEISDPPGPIPAADVRAYDVVEVREGDHVLVHLDLQMAGGRTVRFYTAEEQFDVGLLLDELEAALGDKPRTWTKVEQQPAGNRHWRAQV